MSKSKPRTKSAQKIIDLEKSHRDPIGFLIPEGKHSKGKTNKRKKK